MDKIFRDEDTIPPGQNVQTVIGQAITGTSVCLVLIGPDWLKLKNKDGLRRLDDPHDYVRREIEAALRLGVEVIPVLVDGAAMPSRESLPDSIRKLHDLNFYVLPWQAGILKLGDRIDEIENKRRLREAAARAERDRLDLTSGNLISTTNWTSRSAVASFNVIVRAMEISLARQGHRVWLSSTDFLDTLRKLSGRTEEPMYALPSEITHIIDFVGIKAEKSGQRYVARSYPIKKLEEVPRQLTLGRPVLSGVMVRKSWFDRKVMKSGVIDIGPMSPTVGGVMIALVGWDPATGDVKILTPWSTWGKRGLGTMTKAAAEDYLFTQDMFSIEAVKMPPSPFRHLANQVESKGRGRRKKTSHSGS